MKAIDENKREDIISRIIDRPESLTNEDVQLILEDEELNDLYNVAVLCKSAVEYDEVKIPDVEEELAEFKASRKKNPVPLYKRRSVFVRIAAVFVGVAVSTLVVAAVLEYRGVDIFHRFTTDTKMEQSAENDNVVVVDSSAEKVNEKDLNYDNVTLEEIMNELTTIYNVNVTFEDENVKELRLYVKIEQGKNIREVVEQLGAFEKFDISVNGNSVVVK